MAKKQSCITDRDLSLTGFISVTTGQYIIACRRRLFRMLAICFSLFFLFSLNVKAENNLSTSNFNTLQCSAQSILQQQLNAPNHLVQVSADKKNIYKKSNTKPVAQYTYKIINKIPHDERSFTQGLVMYKNYLYESTGLLGNSEVRKLSIKNGNVADQHKMDSYLFGEGLSVLDDQLVQLTWKSERVITYDPDTLESVKEGRINGEGWGITSVNNTLFYSDGSSLLKKINNSFEQSGNISVQENGVAIEGLNELEYVSGYIYANVWPTDCIAKIDPLSGDVRGWINLSGLYAKQQRPHWTAVMNGIAYKKSSNSFFITGKNWPYIYEIKLLLNKQKNESLIVVDSDVRVY